eukprot:TRINITY_DN7311_c0_g2_i1.p1 TRINITY_DN7311_c0_g2~~TRINITY_DN7311_c0_g2_i1.p1  ORF type:complete len:124 (-),score=30.28 TRINITY_DN7311_c0_g2_i1:482-853(-)
MKKYLEEHEKYKQIVLRDYIAKHKHLYDISQWKFSPQFENAFKTGTPEALRSLLIEVHPGIFAFPMLDHEFCSQFLEEVEWFENWSDKNKFNVQRPNSMNNYGAILDDFGFENTLNDLMKKIS